MSRSLPSELRERLEKAVRESFSVDDLDRILTFKLNRDLSEIVLPKNAVQAVSELFSTSSRKGWLGDLLLELKAARPSAEKADFRQLIDEALAQIPGADSSKFVWTDDVALAPCLGCWWRDAADIKAQKLVVKLRESESEMVKGPGLPRLQPWTLSSLVTGAPPPLGRQIIVSANSLLEEAFCKDLIGGIKVTLLRKVRILDKLDRQDNQANWAAVLAEANARGVKTLVALFLSVYFADRGLRSLADRNLQNLYKRNKGGKSNV